MNKNIIPQALLGLLMTTLIGMSGYTVTTVLNLDKSVALIEFQLKQSIDDRWRRSDALLLNSETLAKVAALQQRIRVLENRGL